MRKHEDSRPLLATNPGSKPADFPLGSLESRAAARMMAKTRAERDTKGPSIYQAHWDTEVMIYDYFTGLPVCEAPADKSPQPQFLQQQQKAETSVPNALPAPGESIDDPPTPPQSQFSAHLITVEID
jgi:hypothetical protein